MQPSARGCSSSIRPLAMVVVANGRVWRSITLRSRVGSPMRIAEEPITAIGRLAAMISSPARLMAASGAGAILAAGSAAGSGSLVGASATSSGKSICTGPFGSLSAVRIACVTISPIRPGAKRSVALLMG